MSDAKKIGMGYTPPEIRPACVRCWLYALKDGCSWCLRGQMQVAEYGFCAHFFPGKKEAT